MKPSTTKSRKTSGLLNKLGLSPLVSRRAATMLATGAMMLAGHSASAQTYWIKGTSSNTTTTATSGGGTGLWETAANWSNGLPDTGPQNAFINNGGTSELGYGTVTTYSAFDVDTGTVANGSGTYMMTGASTVLNVNSWFRMGESAGSTGAFTMNGGTVNIVNVAEVNIGENSGTGTAHTSSLTISGGTFNNTKTGAYQIAIGGQDNNNAGVGSGILTLSRHGHPQQRGGTVAGRKRRFYRRDEHEWRYAQ